ncbi:hypothetical protein ABZ897_00840 [Nonomuraea sp. NPDC046802]|uniref:hypothetical protein n=1 Tax=Nonomuraea sp. NPDC046802 TaxID=3154919 RepID=UPI0033C705D0
MAPTLMDATSTPIHPWFTLTRHDEDATSDDAGDTDSTETEEPAGQDSDTTEPDDSDEPSEEGLGEAGKKALAKTRAERNQAKKDAAAKAKEAATARKEASDARRRAAALEAKVAEFEERDKSEAEKLAARAERAEARAQVATERAVTAEVKAIAAGTFADPTDATDLIGRDPSKYVAEDGEIDVDLIKADLEDLLERKPHWRKATSAPDPEPESAKKPKPKADPSQGPRKEPSPVDYRTADTAEVNAELARLGIRRRL